MNVLVAYLVVGNVVTLALGGLDKRKAGTGTLRTSEATLVGAAAATGTVGGWLGMRVFRHTTQKTSFKVKMVAATLLDIVVLVFVLGRVL